jgi:tetratricopeptide (TPR) repeat protein
MKSLDNGIELFTEGNWDEAIKEFNGCIMGNVKDCDAWRYKGAVCEIRKHLLYEKSLSSMAAYCFEMALLADPNDAISWAYLSVHLNAEGDLNSSQQYLDKFYKAAGQNQAELEAGRAVMDFAQSNYESAQKHFQTVIDADSQNSLAKGFLVAIENQLAEVEPVRAPRARAQKTTQE